MSALQVKSDQELLPDRKAEVLRTHEAYCYQVAYYVLQDASGAQQAAKLALIGLFRQGGFFRLTESGQRKEVKSAAIRCSLQVRKDRLASTSR
jgi:hypothetical protein